VRPSKGATPADAEDIDDISLAEPMVMYHCDSVKIAMDLTQILLEYNKTCHTMVLTQPVPFLNERTVRHIIAATMIQSAWRALKARAELPCGLLTVVVIRRATLCIQRFWRWSLLKRRLALLAGARRFVRNIKGPSLFIEERLLMALNIISSIDRYPPFLKERNLAFGYSVETESIVLVTGALTHRSSTLDARLSRSGPLWQTREGKPPRRRSLTFGGESDGASLPAWLASNVKGMRTVSADDPSLKRVSGVQGLLLEGLGDRADENIITVQAPVLNYIETGDDFSPHLLAATDGALRFVEMKFSTVARAQERALMLYFCTVHTQKHVQIPAVSSKAMLHNSGLWKSILRLWELYSLAWAPGDRVAPYQLKRSAANQQLQEVVHLCGSRRRASIVSSWQTTTFLAAAGGGQAGGAAVRRIPPGAAPNKQALAPSPRPGALPMRKEALLPVPPPPAAAAGASPPQFQSYSPRQQLRWVRQAIQVPPNRSPRDMLAAFGRSPKEEYPADGEGVWSASRKPTRLVSTVSMDTASPANAGKVEVFWSPRSARTTARSLPPLEQ